MWWSEDQWAALADPVECGMCADAHLDENEHSLLVTSTAATHVRIARNQAHRGYCLVILSDHVTDLGDLNADQLGVFWQDVQRAGRAITAVFAPRKIDYLVMGHRMPHLHCHVFPQHSEMTRSAMSTFSDGPVLPSLQSIREDAQALRRAWMAQSDAVL